jgi:hypothetical protein
MILKSVDLLKKYRFVKFIYSFMILKSVDLLKKYRFVKFTL